MFAYFIGAVSLFIVFWNPISQTLFGGSSLSRAFPNRTIEFNESFAALDGPASQCPTHTFPLHVLSREPLIIYLPNFLSEAESKHIIDISEPNFETSTVTSGDDTRIDEQIRKSEVALLERDETVKCIEQRARDFQGWRPNLVIERLRSQRYGPSGHYVHHYDWSGISRSADRISTFMVYVDANCTGGGTEFPRLQRPEDPKWCEFLECEEDTKGITFKPIKGNAVFWENLRTDWTGYEETWHAGLPVTSGTKVGLNIWSWAW